ncbi:hypothetical protein niasHT_006758 [Heterodera trifolii]|uniref:Uncharacterized protein n=1 Tax=Heterodera trifolii TaxID=157864 RepID=A0ABD2LWQ6_9BILA
MGDDDDNGLMDGRRRDERQGEKAELRGAVQYKCSCHRSLCRWLFLPSPTIPKDRSSIQKPKSKKRATKGGELRRPGRWGQGTARHLGSANERDEWNGPGSVRRAAKALWPIICCCSSADSFLSLSSPCY